MSPTLPRVETPRLVIRVPTAADAEEIARYYHDNRPHLEPFQPAWVRSLELPEHWRLAAAEFGQRFAAGEEARFHFFDRADGKSVLGTATLGAITRGAAQSAVLGYGVAARAQGTGIAFEGVGAVVEFGFGELNLHRITANYMPHNRRSGALLRRLGFMVEGYARDYLRIAGRWEDHIMTGRVNPSWRSGAAGHR